METCHSSKQRHPSLPSISTTIAKGVGGACKEKGGGGVRVSGEVWEIINRVAKQEGEGEKKKNV